MKTISLTAVLRENTGKKASKTLLKEGFVPCVLYGNGKPRHISFDERILKKLVYTQEVSFVEIDIEGNKYKAILQDVQYHPVSDKIIHADFLEINDTKEIKMNIPVRLEGTSQGVLLGGKMILKLRKIPVKAFHEKIPNEIVLNIANLNIGDTIKVSDIKNNLYSIQLKDNTVIVIVHKTRKIETVEGEQKEKLQKKKI